MIRFSFTILALLTTLTLAGCSSSPTEIVGGPLVFEGTLAEDEALIFSVVITRAGSCPNLVIETTPSGLIARR